MASYAITGKGPSTTTTSVSAVGVFGSASIKARIKYVEISQLDPGDTTINYIFQRITALGTSTSITPQSLNADDAPTAVCTAGELFTANPTYAGIPWLQHGLYQRSIYRWWAYNDEGALVTDRAANAGAAVHRSAVGGTGSLTQAVVTLHYDE